MEAIIEATLDIKEALKKEEMVERVVTLENGRKVKFTITKDWVRPQYLEPDK